MKWFRYGANVIPDGGIRLAGEDVAEVADPDDADWIVVRNYLFGITEAQWQAVWTDPIITARPERVVSYDCSDGFPVVPFAESVYFRCGATAAQQATCPAIVPWPWPVPALDAWESHYAGRGVDHAVSFIGWVTPLGLTTAACASVQRVFQDRARIALRTGFHGHSHPRAGRHVPGEPLEDAALEALECEYRDALFGSLVALAPESIPGVPRYRINEALSAARVPVWIGSGYCLPFADRIPWSDIVIFVDPADVDRTGEIVAARLDAWGPKETLERGRVGQQAWRQWMHKDRFPELMATVLRERLAAEDRS